MTSRPEFGVSSSKFGGGKRGRVAKLGSTRATTSFQQYGLPTGGGKNDASNVDQRFEDVRVLDNLEIPFGFERYQEGPERLGWLLNMHEVKKV
jgi:DNA polymerase epsilon subunit 1